MMKSWERWKRWPLASGKYPAIFVRVSTACIAAYLYGEGEISNVGYRCALGENAKTSFLTNYILSVGVLFNFLLPGDGILPHRDTDPFDPRGMYHNVTVYKFFNCCRIFARQISTTKKAHPVFRNAPPSGPLGEYSIGVTPSVPAHALPGK